MISLALLTEFFGWLAILNIAMLLLAGFVLLTMRSFIIGIHSRLFKVSEEQLPTLYFKYLTGYQRLTLIFAIAPYLSLKIIA